MIDVQGRADTRRIPINRVGIKDLAYPLRVKNGAGEIQSTVATLSMYVNLPESFKGTHMSRFLEVLHATSELSLDKFPALLETVVRRLESNDAYIEATFPYFVAKAAPVTGVRSMMDYRVTLLGKRSGDDTELTVRVVVPVTSLCPSSKDISQYGAHNQRSHVTITARITGEIGIDDIIRIAELEGSAEVFGILKRADEKYVTEHAYDHPKFVEDLVRDVAIRLNGEPRISGYVVEAENFESIHNHSAYALIEKPAP